MLPETEDALYKALLPELHVGQFLELFVTCDAEKLHPALSMPGFGDRGDGFDRRVRSGLIAPDEWIGKPRTPRRSGTSGDLLDPVSKTDRQAATRYL